jgi:hypothetical protein
MRRRRRWWNRNAAIATGGRSAAVCNAWCNGNARHNGRAKLDPVAYTCA